MNLFFSKYGAVLLSGFIGVAIGAVVGVTVEKRKTATDDSPSGTISDAEFYNAYHEKYGSFPGLDPSEAIKAATDHWEEQERLRMIETDAV